MSTFNVNNLRLSEGSFEELGPCANEGFVDMNFAGVVSVNDRISFANCALT